MNNHLLGDLHAGNILVRNHGWELIFLDAGIVVELGDREADCLVDLFACIVKGDGVGAGELMLARSRSSECTDKGTCEWVRAVYRHLQSCLSILLRAKKKKNKSIIVLFPGVPFFQSVLSLTLPPHLAPPPVSFSL